MQEELEITLDDFVLVDFTRGDLRALLLHVGANRRIAQLAVQLFEAGKEGQAERSRHHVTGSRALRPAAVFATAASTSLVAEIGSLRNEGALLAVLSRGPANVDVMSLANVFDVLRNGGVRADAVFIHQGDQFTLLQVIRRPIEQTRV